jgi:probable rRNA maturation factor
MLTLRFPFSEMKIGIQIDEPFQKSLSERWLRKITSKIIRSIISDGFLPGDNIELGLVITGDEQVKELNRKYRHRDQTTDVLAFALTETKGKVSFPSPPDGILHLGEVIISYPQAIRQAKEYGHSIEQELTQLIIHGILHLVGLEHNNPEAEKEMRAEEEKIVKEVNAL